ncbi:hypothetical protein [Catellatospora tritici]|uniref:hypothetical protein n=1 Tax=Catellatospora tritici TaxID=2851566 RepID=UPI001C2D9C09|nr:hypothetical protein [Catellatospora tritici]MBV1855076.1 hypothetical protein [Catellatospora tritici]
MSLLAAVALGVAMLPIPTKPAAAAAAPTKPAAASHPITGEEASRQAKATGKRVEVPGATTATDTVTANPDGSFTLKRTVEPVRRQVDGVWRDLDPTLRVNADGAIVPTNVTGDIVLSGGGGSPLATMGDRGRSVAFTLPMGLPKPTLQGDTATYTNVLPDVDLEVKVDEQGGFSEVLVVHTPAAAARPEVQQLQLQLRTDGVTVATDAHGNLTGKDRNGEVVLSAPAPQMWDSAATGGRSGTRDARGVLRDTVTGAALASGVHGPGLGAHRAKLGAKVSGGKLTLTADRALLTGKDTVYPVYIDPDVTNAWHKSGWATVSRGYNGNDYSNSNYWKNSPDPDDNLQVGNSNWTNLGIWSRTLLNFNIDPALWNATISNATLHTSLIHSASCTAKWVNVYAPADTLAQANATWNWWNGRSWGSYVDHQLKAAGYTGCTSAQGVEFNVTTAVRSAASAHKPIQTFLLAAADENDYLAYKEFNEVDTSPLSLEVTYNNPPTTPAANALTTSPLTTCQASPSSVIGDADVSLYAQITDPDRQVVSAQFQLWQTSVPGTILDDATTSQVSSGSTAVRVINRTLFQGKAAGATANFSWHVRAWDGSAYSGWSPTCTFTFDQTRLGAPGVPQFADGSTTIGQPFTFTVTRPSATATPSSYLVQLNGGTPSSVTADAANNYQASVTITPTRHTNVLSVISVSAGGNIGDSAQRVFVSNPGPGMPDADLTGDGIADLLSVGGVNNLTSGLWLASGKSNGTVAPAMTNIGVRGIGIGLHDDSTDFDDAIAVTGRFYGAGPQDVLVYYPTGYRTGVNGYSAGENAGGGFILEGRGDGSPLSPIGEANISAGTFNNGYGQPVQLVNAGDTRHRGSVYPDLIGITSDGTTSFLDYFPNNDMVGGFPMSEKLDGVLTPTGDANWQDWTIAAAEAAGGTSLFLWKKSTGALYLWTGLSHTAGTNTLTKTSYLLSSSWSTTSRTLRAADIDGDGDADLWSVDPNGIVQAYLVTLTPTVSIVGQATQPLSSAKHIWALSDALSGAVTTARDPVGGKDLTGNGGVTFTTGDLFSPDVTFDGTSGYLSSSTAGVDTNNDFTVSLWAKPTAAGGVVYSQHGTNQQSLTISMNATVNSWNVDMGRNDSPGLQLYDGGSAGANSAQLNVWSQLTVTFKKSTGELKLYVNGVLSMSITHTSTWTGVNLRIGSLGVSTQSLFFKGQLAIVQSWDSVVDPASPAGYFKPTGYQRLLDTRDGTGGITGPIPVNWPHSLKVTGVGGIPATGVTAVALTVATLSQTAGGVLTIYPSGTPRPSTSSLNWATGVTVSNSVIVPVGASGYINFYITSSSGATAQVIIDSVGYFTTDSAATGITSYTPMTPIRFMDTRNGTGGSTGKITGGNAKVLTIGGVNGVPAGVKAVAINLAAVGANANGFLQTYPDGTARPTLGSGIQYNASIGAFSQLALVPVGTNGKIDIYVSSGSVDLIGDVVGYFMSGTTGQKYHPMAATRLLDTRNDGGPVTGGSVRQVSQSNAVVAHNPVEVLNVTVTGPTGGAYIAIYPDGTSRPSPYSSINFDTGLTIPNMALASTINGTVDIWVSGASTHLVVDCTGYFAAY